MALRVAPAAVHRRLLWAVRQTAGADSSLERDLTGWNRLAAATVLIVASILLGGPPAVAFLVLAGLIR